MNIEEPIYYEDVIKAIDDFEKKGQEIVNKNPNIIIPYYTLDHLSTELSITKSELEKKNTVILEAINYMEKTFELEDEKCITELYDILKKAEEK